MAWKLASIAALLGTSITIPIQPAAAQSPESTRAAAENSLQEIVVTARRREEKLQSVPIAITAFTTADLEKHEISDQYHLQQMVPSMIVPGGGTRDETGFAIRGQSGGALTGEAGVLTYFDEVPSTISAVGSYFDLENVQVLKGPQGTLFGGTSTGGAVLFESAKPRDDFEGYAELTLGAYNWHEFEGAINLPIVAGKVLLRVAGNIDERDGYTKDVGLVSSIRPFISFVDQGYFHSQAGRDYDNRNDQHVRVSLLAHPTDDLDNLLVARYDYRHTNGPGENVYLLNQSYFAAFPAGLSSILAAEVAQQAALGPRKTSYDVPQMDEDQFWQILDKVTWDATDDLTFKNIVSYSEEQTLLTWDEGATPFPIVQSLGAAPTTKAVITEEIQVEGRWLDDALRTTAGFFYEYSHNPNGLLEGNHFLPQPNTMFSQYDSLATSATHEHAGYVQGTYDLGKASSIFDGIKITGGVRYTWFDAAGSSTSLVSPYIPFGSLFLPPPVPKAVSQGIPTCFTGAPGCFYPIADSTISNSHLGWTLQLEDQIDPTTFAYVRAGKAYKPGGNNPYAFSPSVAVYGPEYLQDVEIGVKKDWAFAGMTARTNVALFTGSYSNIQRFTLNAQNPYGFTQNVGDGTIEGVEFEGVLRPGYGLEFDVGYSWTQSGYDNVLPEYKSSLQGVGFPYTPKNKYSVTARYDLPVPNGIGGISISGTYSYMSRYDIAQSGLVATFPYLPSVGVLDVQLDWNNAFGQPLDATLFVTNATDQATAIGGQEVYRQLGIVTRSYQEPRMGGIRLKYRFGGSSSS